jgi:2-polyprenyl-3-methyl-5-hydroxy-6-metoxy-1,4-benzoquinol methylase
MSEFHYVGNELELFSAATVWKGYFCGLIAPFLGADVLEVGAGLGGTTRLFGSLGVPRSRWVCLEPDAEMVRTLSLKIEQGDLPGYCQPRMGTLEDVSTTEQFSAILYIDVLEHIFEDRAEVQKAACLLKPGGRLIVLAPAHPWLFSPFDRAIGHYRRYTRSSLRDLRADGLVEELARYLDAAGMLASSANRLLLRQSMPSPGQIAFWDRVLVRMSRVVDRVLGYSIGKSVLFIWRRNSEAMI